MWQTVKDRFDAPVQFPYSASVEGSTLSVVEPRGDMDNATRYLVSIGGYGDDDEWLSVFALPISVLADESCVVADAPWIAIDDLNGIFRAPSKEVCREDLRSSLSDASSTLEPSVTKFLCVEGHTAVVIDKDIHSHRLTDCYEDIHNKVRTRLTAQGHSPQNLCLRLFDKILVFGGMNDSYEKSNEMKSVQLIEVTFKSAKSGDSEKSLFFFLERCAVQRGDGPPPVYRHAAAYCEDSMYVFGGDVDDRSPSDTGFYRFCFSENAWETLESPGEAFVLPQHAKLSPNHTLATLSVIDKSHIMLIGGYDFDASSHREKKVQQSGLVLLTLNLIYRTVQRVFRKVQSAFSRQPIPLCAQYNTETKQWTSIYLSSSARQIPMTDVNGHAGFIGDKGRIYWCGGKKNAYVCAESQDIGTTDTTSGDIDAAFTGDQHGEVYCLQADTPRSLLERLSNRLGLNYFSQATFEYSVHQSNDEACAPRGLYMPASCTLFCNQGKYRSSRGTSIFFLMGGNRRHFDEAVGNVCWYFSPNEAD